MSYIEVFALHEIEDFKKQWQPICYASGVSTETFDLLKEQGILRFDDRRILTVYEKQCVRILVDSGATISYHMYEAESPPWVVSMVDHHKAAIRSVCCILASRSRIFYKDVMGVIAKHLFTMR